MGSHDSGRDDRRRGGGGGGKKMALTLFEEGGEKQTGCREKAGNFLTPF